MTDYVMQSPKKREGGSKTEEKKPRSLKQWCILACLNNPEVMELELRDYKRETFKNPEVEACWSSCVTMPEYWAVLFQTSWIRRSGRRVFIKNHWSDKWYNFRTRYPWAED